MLFPPSQPLRRRVGYGIPYTTPHSHAKNFSSHAEDYMEVIGRITKFLQNPKCWNSKVILKTLNYVDTWHLGKNYIRIKFGWGSRIWRCGAFAKRTKSRVLLCIYFQHVLPVFMITIPKVHVVLLLLLWVGQGRVMPVYSLINGNNQVSGLDETMALADVRFLNRPANHSIIALCLWLKFILPHNKREVISTLEKW